MQSNDRIEQVAIVGPDQCLTTSSRNFWKQIRFVPFTFYLIFALIILSIYAQGQVQQQSFFHLPSLSEEGFAQIRKLSNGFSKKMADYCSKHRNSIQRHEEKMLTLLWAKDSAVAHLVVEKLRLIDFESKEGMATSLTSSSGRKWYIGKLDSLQSCLKFIEEANGGKVAGGISDNSRSALAALTSLQSSMDIAQRYSITSSRRQKILQTSMDQLGLLQKFTKYKKEIFYFKQKIVEYKEVLTDTKKLTSKALELVQQTESFKKYFANHSALAKLFVLPGATMSDAIGESVPELQTRQSIIQVVKKKYGKDNDVQSLVNIQATSTQIPLQGLMEKIPLIEQHSFGYSETADLPDFSVNTNRTSNFFKRLEFGTNIQTTRGNLLFPVTSDVAVSLGYRINDKLVTGIGGSLKVGWGENWQHIKISGEGFSLRTYLDWRLKGNWWVSAGGELNYRDKIRSFREAYESRMWSESALAGIKKKYSIRKRLNGNVQLLYDFLWKPEFGGQPLLFRIGYTFGK